MNYPLWNLFLTMLELFIWIVLIVLVVWVILSIFRSHMSGWAKVGWLVLVILVPFIGVFAYLIVRGAHLAGEQVATAGAPQDERYRRYERFESQGQGDPDDLAELARGFGVRAWPLPVVLSWSPASLG